MPDNKKVIDKWPQKLIDDWENTTRPLWDVWEEWDTFTKPIQALIKRLKDDKSREKTAGTASC